MTAFDFDGDGDDELVLALPGGRIEVYRIDDKALTARKLEQHGHQLAKGWEIRGLFRRSERASKRPFLFAHIVSDADGSGRLLKLRPR